MHYKSCKKMLTMRSNIRSLSLTIYDEQLPDGWDKLKEVIVAFDKKLGIVIAIRHYKDLLNNNIRNPSYKKLHYHIIFHLEQDSPIRVNQLLRLLNIRFRENEDDYLWENGGVETIRNFSSMAMYLTHETPQAILDGEERYDFEELVSNLSPDELKQIRDGYLKATKSSYKLKPEDLVKLDAYAYQLGYELGNYKKWYTTLDFFIRSNSKMRTIRESYDRGVEARVNEDKEVNRLCVFISGEKNLGKTYAALEALKDKDALTIGGTGTGKFDDLLPHNGALILDDDSCGNLLNMTDNYMCQAYRRNSGNPFWCGEYFIVTSNLTFEEWAKKCGIETQTWEENVLVESENFRAIQSRFFICHIGKDASGTNTLICDSHSARGDAKAQQERLEKYMDFREKVNRSLAAYKPSTDTVDYSGINGDLGYEAVESVAPEEPPIERAIINRLHEENTMLYNLLTPEQQQKAEELGYEVLFH